MSKTNNSSQVAALIFPTHGCRDDLRRKGIKPKNFHRDNLEYIRSLENRPRSAKTAAQPVVPIDPNSTNFIERNISYAKTLKVPKNDELEDESEVCNRLGEVPEYLQSIKTSLNENKLKRENEESKKLWPAGTRLLGDREKNEKIKELEDQRAEVLQRLNKLPFTSDTNMTRERRSKCEFKLKELEFELSRLKLKQVFYPL